MSNQVQEPANVTESRFVFATLQKMLQTAAEHRESEYALLQKAIEGNNNTIYHEKKCNYFFVQKNSINFEILR